MLRRSERVSDSRLQTRKRPMDSSPLYNHLHWRGGGEDRVFYGGGQDDGRDGGDQDDGDGRGDGDQGVE